MFSKRAKQDATSAKEPINAEDTSPNPPVGSSNDGYDYPTGLRLALILTSIYISVFLVALDKLIISTATPAITNDFQTSSDIGWYGTAYLLTNAAFLLVFGKMYTFLNVKYVFLAAVVLFEVGSAICGAAANSVAFIIGRAVAGLGAGGVQSGAITLIVYAVPLEKRPAFQGLFGAVYGVSSVLGPLVGGAFTSHVTWRWCFWLNLPLGGLVLAFVTFALDAKGGSQTKTTLKEKLLQLNLEGLLALLPGVICLCLALEWGGFTYSAIKGNSAVASGIHLLPQVLALVVASIVAGVLSTKIGYFTPFLLGGVCVTAVGAGLITTLGVNSTEGQWIGYQVIYGFGFGLCIQAPNLAAQVVLPREEASIGASLMLFANTIFGAIFVSVGQNVLDSNLVSRLKDIIQITAEQIESAGATGLLDIVPAQYKTDVLYAYNGSLRVCFQVALVMACVCIIPGLAMEWRSVKKQDKKPNDEETLEKQKSKGACAAEEDV
ncbi:hypothetical protein LTS14_004400 [Recurvomyces mirabilis]|uniref:uncharacterized protein n=1 Tax=Recurvomyces mirabilis TaxID=574656 RepID=UPI002DE0672E|nr:hypothetical protein LTS14_004400 [Recurvomyces mirabilis]